MLCFKGKPVDVDVGIKFYRFLVENILSGIWYTQQLAIFDRCFLRKQHIRNSAITLMYCQCIL